MFKQLALTSTIIAIAFGASLPPSFKRCNAKDEQCLIAGVPDALKQLMSGNKELGVRSIDPLEIKSMHVPGHGGQVDLDQTYNNIKLLGVGSAKINKFVIDLDKCLFDVEALIPSLSVVSDYVLRGQLLVFPINGHGLSNNTFTNMKIAFQIKCDRVERNGAEYLDVKGLDLTFDPEEVNFSYANIVDNEEISNEIRKVLNENSKVIFEDIRKDYETSYALVFKDYTKKIFDKVPVRDIFLS